MDMLRNLLYDESGFVITVELILIVTILVLGLIAGLTALRNAITSELSDVAGAIQHVNQSYSIHGIQGNQEGSTGSDFSDRPTDSNNCTRVFRLSNEF